MSLARFLDNSLMAISEFLHNSVCSGCRLSTVADDYTLVADDGTLVTFIELQGAIQLFGAEEFNLAVESIYSSCSSYLKKQGHALQFVIHHDPDGAYEELGRYYNPIKSSAQALGMTVDRIVEDTRRKQAQYTASESVWAVVWTYPYALPPSTEKAARKKASKETLPKSDRYTMPFGHLEELRKTHENFSNAVLSGFSKGKLWADRLDVHKALWAIRKINDPDMTSRNWKARLPGDRLPLHESDDGDEALTGALCPSLKTQLYPRPAITTSETVQIGDYLHKPFCMELAPERPKNFTALYNELIKNGFGWRISYTISGEGLNGTRGKKALAQILSFTSSTNRMLLRSLNELQDMQERGGQCLVTLEMNFDTWVNTRMYRTHEDAQNALSVNFNYFVAAVQSWGTMDVREVVGDPLLPFTSSIPGLSLKTPSNKAIAPFSDVVSTLPFTLAASPWETGSLVLRSIDGRIFPVEQLSSQQASWIEVGGGGMGAGKSVWIGTSNWSFVIQPGLDELPYLGIIDIGPSSAGFIKLLKTVLPKDKQKFVASHKLKMDSKYAINPFDTPVGVRMPFNSHLTFLINLLSVFCTPLDKEAPGDGVTGILRHSIIKAYKDKAGINANRYELNIDRDLDDKIQRLDLAVDEHTCWWDIVDAFFDAGLTHEATLAQRYAVPLLSDVAAFVTDNTLKTMYSYDSDATNQTITAFVERKLCEAYAFYPIFQKPTKFDLGEARIVSLDLDEVAPKGGAEADRQSGVMYLLAKQLLAGNWFFDKSDCEGLPPQYYDYHTDLIAKLQKLPKKLSFDEFHRATRTGPVMRQFIQDIETLSRESRKWLIALAFYSQKLEDMPDTIIELANNVYILGAGSHENQKKIIQKFGLNSACGRALPLLGTPGEAGANFIALMRINGGFLQLLLTNTLGPMMLWGLSSTREDMSVRDALYERCNHQDVLEVLASNYPSGVKSHVANLRLEYANKGIKQDAIETVIQETIDEIQRAGFPAAQSQRGVHLAA